MTHSSKEKKCCAECSIWKYPQVPESTETLCIDTNCSCHQPSPKEPEEEWGSLGIEEKSAKIHTLYCQQYEEDNGKPYWTNGDYSKLDERTKEYDRNIVRFIDTISIQAKSQGISGVSQWAEYGKKYGYWEYFEKETKSQGAREALEETILEVKKLRRYFRDMDSTINNDTVDKVLSILQSNLNK